MGTDSVGNCAETSSGKRFAFLLVFGRAAMGNAGMAAVFSRLVDTAGTSTAWFGHTVGLSTQPCSQQSHPLPLEQDARISSMGKRKTNAQGVLKVSFLKKCGPKHHNTSFEGQYLLCVKQGKVLTAPET